VPDVGALSLELGSVRLHERYFSADPPNSEQLAAARAEVRSFFGRHPAPEPFASLIGVGGTVTSLAVLALELAAFDACKIHGAALSLDTVEALSHRFATSSIEERSALPGLERGRADVILAGSIIVAESLRWAGVDRFTVSTRGLRWGLLSRIGQIA